MVADDVLPAAVPTGSGLTFEPLPINDSRAINVTCRVDFASHHDRLPNGETGIGRIVGRQVL